MSTRGGRAVVAGLLGLLGVAALLRFFELGHDSLWVDEAFSDKIASVGGLDIFDQATSADPNPPLYYVILHWWIAAFGDSEAALRSLSAVVGIALVFVVFKLGERLGGSKVGLIAASRAAVSEFLVHYSQEARVYSLVALLTAGSYYFFLELLDDPRVSVVALYVFVTGALLYAHVYGLFVLAAQIAYVAVAVAVRRDWIRAPDLKPIAVALAAPTVLAIPWFVIFVGHVRAEVKDTDEAKLSWLGKPSIGELPGAFSGYAGSRGALLVVALALLVVAFLGLRKDGRSGIRRVVEDRRVAMLLLWIAVPILVPFAISLVVTPIYLFKYTIPAAIGFYLLVALALVSLGARAGLVAGAVVAVAFLSVTVRYYGDSKTEDWRNAAAYLTRNAKPGDAVVFDSSVGRTAFDYYWKRDDVEEVVGSHFSGLSADDLASVRAAAKDPGDVWLVVSHSRDPEGRIPAVILQSQHQLGAQAEFVGIRVDQYR